MMIKTKVVVAPFQNKSDSSWDYLCDGLRELANNTLMNNPSLVVIGLESAEQALSMEAKNTLFDSIKVDQFITASLKVEDQLFLQVMVFKKNQKKPFWKKEINSDLKQVISFGNQLVNLLTEKFQLQTPHSESRNKLPVNRQAYRAHLLGNHYLNKWNRAYTELALVQFEKVIELEPDFIPAYLGVAKATIFLVSRGYRNADLHYPTVTKMLGRMLLLNPLYGELYIYKGIIEFFYLLDWDSAYRNIEKGLKNFSEASEAYAQLSLFWYGMRQYDKALEAIYVALEYNPLSISLLNMKGDIFISAKRYQEANKVFHSILELQADDKVALENLMYIASLQNNESLSKKYLRRLTQGTEISVFAYPRIAYIYAKFGMQKELDNVLKEFERLAKDEKNLNLYGRLAAIYTPAGDWNKVLSYLEKYFEQRMGIIYILTDPMFEPIRNWKRYKKMEQQIKLPSGILEEKTVTIQSDLKSTIEINPKHLLYVKSEENYATLVVYNNFRLEENLLRISLKNLVKQLPENLFFQCHRSYIVNKTVAFKSIGNARGYTLTSLEYGFEIPVSRSKIEEMKSTFSF